MAAALALAAAGCATESLLTDAPKAVTEFAMAPDEIHEECARLAAGDQIDYRFSAQAPVKFHIYYTEGLIFLSPLSPEDGQEFAGTFRVRGLPTGAYFVRTSSANNQGLIDEIHSGDRVDG